MPRFTLQEILTTTKGEAFACSEQLKFDGLSTDTRDIKDGNLFVAFRGERFDGHDYIEEALQKGALAVLVEETREENSPVILVENTLKAYQDVARYNRCRYDIPVVAITGSSGKTTTKEMVAAVLETKLAILKTEKNFNNEIGLPKTLLALEGTHEACVLEMGMRGLGQIEELANIALPTIGIITNVGTSHIELLGSKEGIAQAKGELIESLPTDGYAILNGDDEYVRPMKKKANCNVVTYGIEEQATVRAFNLRYKKDGIKFSCQCFDEVFDVFLPMIGIHNVYDALAAIAVGRILGLNSGTIIKGLGNFKGIPMRQEVKNYGYFVLLNDTYNANPASMSESIKALGQLDGKRKVAILGDMLELGEFAEEAHRQIGKLLVEEGYGAVLLLGENIDYIYEECEKGSIPFLYKGSRHDEVAQFYKSIKEEGDAVLLKGSRGLHMEKVEDFL